MTSSDLPLWAQIAEVLRRRIAQGDADPSAFTDTALAAEFGVSVMTVRQAVQRLVSDGLLVRQRGRGTFIARQPVRGRLQLLAHYLEDWRLQGRVARVEILQRTLVAASLSLSAELGVASGSLVGYIQRLRFVDDYQIALDHRYLPQDLNAALSDTDLRENPIFPLLREKLQLSVANAKLTIRAVAATEEESRHLGVPAGAPLLDRGLQMVGTDGRILMTGHSLYHPDRFIYATTVPLSPDTAAPPSHAVAPLL